VRNTEHQGLGLKTKTNYRNRIKEIYIFFSTDHADYYSIGMRQLSKEERTLVVSQLKGFFAGFSFVSFVVQDSHLSHLLSRSPPGSRSIQQVLCPCLVHDGQRPTYVGEEEGFSNYHNCSLLCKNSRFNV
jgi:hypothetical protein